jgi:hypothetical protein
MPDPIKILDKLTDKLTTDEKRERTAADEELIRIDQEKRAAEQSQSKTSETEQTK